MKRYDLWKIFGIKFVLKAEQKKAIEKLLAFLPTGYGKSLSVQLLALLVKRAGNYIYL